MKELKVISLYFFLIVNLFSGLHLEAKSIVSGDIVEGQAYQPNFLKQKGHFEKNANGTTAYADAAGTRPVYGSGGAPTLSCTRTTSSPIDGDGSLLITKDAANRQGQGCTIQFTIDSAYKAKVLQIEFDYLVASGTFTAGSSSADSDLIVYIYDVTNSTLIEPSSIKLLSNSSTISDHFVANFQTSATGTTYNLILHQATTSSSAYTVKADNFEVKPSKYIYGTPITDWVAYTPTQLNTTNVNFNTAYWRRVGDSIEVSGRTTWNGAGAGGQWTVQLPSGLTFDTTKTGSSANDTSFGIVNFLDSGVNWRTGNVIYGSTTTVKFTVDSATDNLLGSGFTSGDAINYKFSGPITGWSSSTQVSDGYDGRLITASYTGTSGTITAGGARFIVDAPTKVVDKTSAVTTGASWKFTAPSSGTYQVNYVATHSSVTLTTGASLEAEVYKNGSVYAAIARHVQQAATAVNPLLSGSLLVELNAGDYIDVREAVGGAVNATINSSRIDVYKLQAPTTISATETTVFYTYTGSPTGTLNSSYNTTTFGTSGTFYDTHGNYSSGVYTFRDPGCYNARASVHLTHSTAAGYLDVGLSYNNSAPFVADYKYVNGSGDTTQNVSGVICVRSGDTLRVQTKTNLTTPAYSSNAPYNYFIISKIK